MNVKAVLGVGSVVFFGPLQHANERWRVVDGGLILVGAWSRRTSGLGRAGGSRSGSTDAGAEQMEYDSILAGWWFQTFFLLSIIYGIILPSDQYFSEG